MIKIFKNTQLSSLLLALVFLTGFAFLLKFLSGVTPDSPLSKPFPEWLPFDWENRSSGRFGASFYLWLLIMLVQSLTFGVIASRRQILHKDTWLPVIFFGLWQMLFPEQMDITPQIFATLFLLLAVMILLLAQGREQAMPALVNTGLASGLAYLMVPGTLFFVPVFIAGIWLFKPFRFVDLFQYLFGYFFFPGLALTFLYGMEHWEPLLAHFSTPIVNLGMDEAWRNPALIGFGIYVALIFLVTFIGIQQNFFKNTVKVRKMQQFLFVYFLFSVLFLLVGAEDLNRAAGLLSVPVSVFMSHHFLTDKRPILKELEFWLVLAGIGLLHYPLF